MLELSWITAVRYSTSNTVEPLNNGHSGDERFVHCSEVVPLSEVEMHGQLMAGGKQFVHCREVVLFIRVSIIGGFTVHLFPNGIVREQYDNHSIFHYWTCTYLHASFFEIMC